MPDNYKLMLVGLTKEQILDMPENVIGIERTQNINELAAIYTMADVFLNLSYEETMGLVTAEALACGTPAIVYDKTAVPEVVDGRTGIIVHAGDIKSVANAIHHAINLKADDCVERALQYESKKQFKQIIDLYY